MSEGIVIAFITGVLGPLAVLLVKKFYDSRKKSDVVEDTIKISETITSKLEEIMEEVNADRVWIAQFHNGGNFYPTGKSMAKFSILYEMVQNGASSVQMNFQNIPVNLFSRPINHMLNNDYAAIPDFEDETVATYGLKYVAEEMSTKSCYLFAIKSLDDKFIGVLCVDYTKNKINLDSMTLYHIQFHCGQLGVVLMESLKKN